MGRDAQVAAALLREGGQEPEIVADLPGLVAEIRHGAGMAVIVNEALIDSDLRPLTEALGAQEPWSDFPILVLTNRGGGLEQNPAASRLADLLGNVTFLERPFHPTTIVSVTQSAIRGRRRQYDARARLIALTESQERLSRLTENLEQRVEQELTERRKAEEALRQSQKMEALGQLTGGVAHDFNNLLMAITGNLDLLRKRIGSDPKSGRLIDGALQGARRGAALTKRMLAFARQQDLTTRPVDLGRMVMEMQDLLVRTLGPRISLEFSLARSVPRVKLDPTQIELAILNLSINARDAMPGGGTITIKVDCTNCAPSDLRPGRYVRLRISDNGSGMDEITLKKATEPFFSTKPVGKGTGLGLSMVHGLAVQLGGLFELESALGKGTTATIWFPATDEAIEEAEVPGDGSSNLPVTKPATILVVDDDALISMATADMLQDLGHTVVEASSGKMAMDIVKGGQHVDLVVTDHAMAGMTGTDLAEKLREWRPELPILLATGYADPPVRQHLDLPRLSKPYTQEALRNAIGKLLS